MSADPIPEDDDASRNMILLAEELFAEHGEGAVRAFGELLEWVERHPDQDWQQELEDGIAALRRGGQEQVRARLAELGGSDR